MAASCPECDGRGWVRYMVENTDGQMETAYRMCGCGRSGVAVPVACSRPGCDKIADKSDPLCGSCRAEWDMNSGAEAWGMAEDILHSLADAMETGVALPELDEAMQGAITHAQTAKLYHEQERDRIGEAS